MKKTLAVILALGATAAAATNAYASGGHNGHNDGGDKGGKTVVNNDYSKTKKTINNDNRSYKTNKTFNNDNRSFKTINNTTNNVDKSKTFKDNRTFNDNRSFDNRKTLNYDDSNKAFGGQGGAGLGIGVGQGGKGGNADVRNSGNSANKNVNQNVVSGGRGGNSSLNNSGNSKAFGGNGGFAEGGNANANANTNSAASANGGGNGNNVAIDGDVYESDIFDAQYIAPNQYLPDTTGYSFGITNKMGSLKVHCPVSSKQFNVGAWLGGIGWGSNSDDLPEDCQEGAGLIKTSYYDNLMFHGVEKLDHFDQIHARCVAVAEAYKHNYGRTKSVSACVQAMSKSKKKVIKKHVLPPLPPIEHKPIMKKPAPLPQPMPMPMPKPELPDDAEKNG